MKVSPKTFFLVHLQRYFEYRKPATVSGGVDVCGTAEHLKALQDALVRAVGDDGLLKPWLIGEASPALDVLRSKRVGDVTELVLAHGPPVATMNENQDR